MSRDVARERLIRRLERERSSQTASSPQAQAARPSDASTGRAHDVHRKPAPRRKDAVIDVQKLSKTYPNGTEAVRDVSFSVSKGEVFGILGPNGAGKSTTIGILGTLVRPTGGHARVDGLDVTRESMAVRRKIGFAMQEAGVDELAKGIEFLLLQARLYGIKKRDARKRAHRLLELFELTAAARKRLVGYSGGMKRRIDLAAALIHEPPIIFLDEPTEGLDPRSRRALWGALKKLKEDQGATILLSTHYMDEAEALCDRIAIMDQGRIVATGAPRELKETVGGQSIQLAFDAVDRVAVMDRAEAAIRKAGASERIVRTETELHAYVADAGRATPELLRVLDHAGVSPASLSIMQPSLDDVYLKYTGRTLEAAEAEDKRSTKEAARLGAKPGASPSKKERRRDANRRST